MTCLPKAGRLGARQQLRLQNNGSQKPSPKTMTHLSGINVPLNRIKMLAQLRPQHFLYFLPDPFGFEEFVTVWIGEEASSSRVSFVHCCSEKLVYQRGRCFLQIFGKLLEGRLVPYTDGYRVMHRPHNCGASSTGLATSLAENYPHAISR